MTRVYLSALACAAILAAVPFASAHADPVPGWYVGGGVGANFAHDSTAHHTSGDSTIEYDPGLTYLGNVGYGWRNGLRLEGEAMHSRSNVVRMRNSPANSSYDGHLSNTDLFANVFYDINTNTRLTPYVGAGAGVAFVNADNIGVFSNNGFIDGTETEFAYQGILGVAAKLDKNWALTADYRYIRTTEPSFKNTLDATKSATENVSHNVIFGIRYTFGQPEAPVAQVMPAPEPAPAMRTAAPPQVAPLTAERPVVAPVPQSYMVFFDFDRSDLTAEAKRILASAAQDFQRGGYVRIVVTGHTDTMGTNKYNQKLSERRAAAVRVELMKLGVDRSAIAANGVGEDGLLVPTNDQVREAQNRRAEIVFNR
ncbi:MAG: OmpA family protein [Bdellovibrionales bacterium]